MRNASQQDVWYANYRPFGEAITAGPATLDMRLPGQWFQMETGLSWNWHRTYDPSLGRYLQPDPLGLTDGPSVYGYAHQTPLMEFDPDGNKGIVKVLRFCMAVWGTICNNEDVLPPEVEVIEPPPIASPECIDMNKVRRKNDP